MTTSRMESFSDGVFAVAITLLSLSLLVPGDDQHTLAHNLLKEWPSYAAYVISFVTIGIIWINHHVALKRLAHPDHAVLVLNLGLLMSICAIPFATNLMATYLDRHHGADVATAVYMGVLAWMGASFVALNWFMLLRRPQLLVAGVGSSNARTALTRGAAGVVPYFVALGLAFVSPYIALAISGVVALYYAFPIASSGD